MKISELTSKSFLGAAGAAENSYVLVNYEDSSTSEPVTYKATIEELGNAIVNKLKIPVVTYSGGVINGTKVKKVYNGAWSDTTMSYLDPDASDITCPSDQYIMVYDSSDNKAYYINGQTETEISLGGGGGGGAIDPSEPVLLAEDVGVEPSIRTLPVFVDNDGIFYDASNSGAAVAHFRTGDLPVVLFDSDGALVYYSDGNSTPVSVTTVNACPVLVYDSAVGVGYFEDPEDTAPTALGIPMIDMGDTYMIVYSGTDGICQKPNLSSSEVYPFASFDINGKPAVVYDTTNSLIKYYDSTNEQYNTIPIVNPLSGYELSGHDYYFISRTRGDLNLYEMSESEGYQAESLGKPLFFVDGSIGVIHVTNMAGTELFKIDNGTIVMPTPAAQA